MLASEKLPQLRIGTEWIEMEITSEADVSLTFKGYAPIVKVKDLKLDLIIFYICITSNEVRLLVERVCANLR